MNIHHFDDAQGTSPASGASEKLEPNVQLIS
jgi:hypothetical protein